MEAIIPTFNILAAGLYNDIVTAVLYCMQILLICAGAFLLFAFIDTFFFDCRIRGSFHAVGGDLIGGYRRAKDEAAYEEYRNTVLAPRYQCHAREERYKRERNGQKSLF